MDPAAYRELLKWQKEPKEASSTYNKGKQSEPNYSPTEEPFFTREQLALRAQRYLTDFNKH